MALLTSPFPIDDADAYRHLNPHVIASQPDSFGNKNLVIPDRAQSMLTGTGLVVLIIRSLGLVMGAATIAMIHKIGAYIAPHRPIVALAAAAVTAFNPMFYLRHRLRQQRLPRHASERRPGPAHAADAPRPL